MPAVQCRRTLKEAAASLSGDKPLDAAAELAPAHPANNRTGAAARRQKGDEGYSGWSARGDAGR